MFDDKQQLARRLRSLRTTATDGTVAFPRFQQDQLVKLYSEPCLHADNLYVTTSLMRFFMQISSW